MHSPVPEILRGTRVKSVSVVLVDDHRVVTRSLKAWLESFPDIRVVGIAVSGEELLQRLDEWKPDVILQDLLMPGGIDGIETTRRILLAAPSARVIALTASMDEARMMGVLRAGAVGYIRKDAEPETLLAAVRAVAAGRTYIDPTVGKQILMQPSGMYEELTLRETDVLRQLALGLSNKEIAGALSIGEETVKSHVGSLFAKLGVENRAQAVVRAIRLGIVSLEEWQKFP
jgi:NarL family two-component system response regulator LiaR